MESNNIVLKDIILCVNNDKNKIDIFNINVNDSVNIVKDKLKVNESFELRNYMSTGGKNKRFKMFTNKNSGNNFDIAFINDFELGYICVVIDLITEEELNRLKLIDNLGNEINILKEIKLALSLLCEDKSVVEVLNFENGRIIVRKDGTYSRLFIDLR